MREPMPDEEIDQAVKALRGWFISQDICPADAGLVMMRLMATMLLDKTHNIAKLQEAISLNQLLLATEIATRLR